MNPLPDDHDCGECDCDEGSTLHAGSDGLCLACGGCWDPECCIHDVSCDFAEPEFS